jgi:CheY-like chemotaxis protein
MGEARKVIEGGGRFDISIIDARIADGAGEEFARMFREGGEATRSVIVLTSAVKSSKSQVVVGRECQKTCHLIKPAKPSELKKAIASVLACCKKEGRAAQAEAQGLRVLIAETNPINQRLTARALEKRGCVVALAQGGRQAVDTFSAQTFDLILMDLDMPDRSGIEATEAIRKIESQSSRPRRIPIIGMASEEYGSERDLCIEAGIDRCLSKPIQRGELSTIIEEAIRANS